MANQRQVFNRREFALGSLATLGGIPWLQAMAGKSRRDGDQEPHFFLHLCVSGGVDATYMFDARPLAFTDQNLLANYAYKNKDSSKPLLKDPSPITYQGSNGQTCWRSPLTDPLLGLSQDFSVINGVMMSPQFNGHGSNMYYMFTNSPTNGPSFMPMIGATAPFPIQSLHFGGFEGDGNQQPANFGLSARLDHGLGGQLALDLVTKRRVPESSSAAQFLSTRLQQRSSGHSEGSFDQGVKVLAENTARLPKLADALVASQGLAGQNTDEELADKNVRTALKTALLYFKGNVTRSVTIMLDRDPVIDVHSARGAQNQINLYPGIVATIKELLNTLKATAYDADRGRSFFDVTTVLVSSEFARTMRQPNEPIDNTGTDHNPFTNSLLVAGKGIRGGQLFGASDLQALTSSGEFTDVSQAHRQFDKNLISPMGRPFDFAHGTVRDDRPSAFKINDYLTIQSVVNTLFYLFGVKEADWFSLGGERMPILKQLLKG